MAAIYDIVFDPIHHWLNNLPTSALTALGIVLILLMSFYYALQIIDKFISVTRQVYAGGFMLFRTGAEKVAIRRRRLFLEINRRNIEAVSTRESWDDQAFAEIDAEVAIHGRFFQNAIARLFRRSSTGIRKVRSVSAALEATANKRVLILGEPASGKSVALRHLVIKLSRKSQKSNAVDAIVPLYINLRHLDQARYSPLNSESITAFILDSIRHNSPVTVEFVKDNWNYYCASGLWHFAFDSFDEIPELLHAEDGESVASKYSAAIVDFLNTTGDCKAIIASRIFRSPSLPGFGRLKLIALSRKRQIELVSRALIQRHDRNRIEVYLGSEPRELYKNPLFLTLLCNFIARHHDLPANDHALLREHIKTLIQRDQDYCQRAFGLSSKQLLAYAKWLASIYADQKNLRLSVSREEILAAADAGDEISLKIDNILNALTACKILRRDVSDETQDTSRYVFSHRRYQETLFVEYILAPDSEITAEQIVSDRKRREYVVTLLQGQEPLAIIPYLTLLQEKALASLSRLKKHEVLSISGGPIYYIEWSRSDAAYYLGVLREGLRGRYNLLSDGFRVRLGAIFNDLIDRRDVTDKFMVLFFSQLAAPSSVLNVLNKAISSSSSALQSEAFENGSSIGLEDPAFGQEVRRRFANQVLSCSSRIERLRTEAMLENINENLRCRGVYRRAILLRAPFSPAIIGICLIYRFIRSKFGVVPANIVGLGGQPYRIIPIVCSLFLAISISIGLSTFGHSGRTITIQQIISFIAIVVSAGLLLTFSLRDEAEPLRFNHVSKRISRLCKRYWRSDEMWFLVILFFCFIIAWFVAHVILTDFIFSPSPETSALAAGTMTVTLFSILMTVWIRHDRVQSRAALQNLRRANKRPIDILWDAREPIQCWEWFVTLIQQKAISEREVRLFFAAIALCLRNGIPPILARKPLFNHKSAPKSLEWLSELMLDNYLMSSDLPEEQVSSAPNASDDAQGR